MQNSQRAELPLQNPKMMQVSDDMDMGTKVGVISFFILCIVVASAIYFAIG